MYYKPDINDEEDSGVCLYRGELVEYVHVWWSQCAVPGSCMWLWSMF